MHIKVIFSVCLPLLLAGCLQEPASTSLHGQEQRQETQTINPGIAVDLVIFDDFDSGHGDVVTEFAQGLYSKELHISANTTFHKRSLSEHVFNSELDSTPIYNRSFSSIILSTKKQQDIADIAALEPLPLVVTSAGNTQNSCTPEAADIGRSSGLASLGISPEFYLACDMSAVAAVDAGADEHWIVVGSPFSNGQKPGSVLMHRWIGAPYVFYVDGQPIHGTSYGAPYVSTIAAEIVNKVPGISAEEVANIIFDTAFDKGAPGVDEVYGHGYINLKGIRAYIDSLEP